jgi:hypothetical protein
MSAYVALGNHMWFSQPSTRRLLHVRFLVYRLQDYEHALWQGHREAAGDKRILEIQPIRSGLQIELPPRPLLETMSVISIMLA